MCVGNINFLLLVPKGALKKNVLIINRANIFVVMLLLTIDNNWSLGLTGILQSEYICFLRHIKYSMNLMNVITTLDMYFMGFSFFAFIHLLSDIY